MGKQRSTRPLIRLAAGLIVSLALASSAAATSVDVYGNPLDWGLDLSGLCGVASLPDQGVGSFLTTDTNDITISTPASTSGEDNPTGGFIDPSNGASVWTVTANDRSYSDAWLVIVGHAIAGPEADPHGPAGDGHYVTANVGLAVDDADPLLRIDLRRSGLGLRPALHAGGDGARLPRPQPFRRLRVPGRTLRTALARPANWLEEARFEAAEWGRRIVRLPHSCILACLETSGGGAHGIRRSSRRFRHRGRDRARVSLAARGRPRSRGDRAPGVVGPRRPHPRGL